MMESRLEGMIRADPMAIQKTVLNLDGLNLSSMGAQRHHSEFMMIARFSHLKSLSMASTGCVSLYAFPFLPKLRKMNLANNKITTTEPLLRARLTQLSSLNLSNNPISDFKAIESLAYFPLVNLNLSGCPVTQIKEYREMLFSLIPTLEVLDEMDSRGKPVSSVSLDCDDDSELDDEDQIVTSPVIRRAGKGLMSKSKGKGKNAGKKTMGKSMKRGETNDIDEEQEDYSEAESIVEAEEEVLDALGNDDSMSGSEDEEDSEPHDVESEYDEGDDNEFELEESSEPDNEAVLHEIFSQMQNEFQQSAYKYPEQVAAENYANFDLNDTTVINSGPQGDDDDDFLSDNFSLHAHNNDELLGVHQMSNTAKRKQDYVNEEHGFNGYSPESEYNEFKRRR